MNACCFSCGVLVGFLASSFIFMTAISFDPPLTGILLFSSASGRTIGQPVENEKRSVRTTTLVDDTAAATLPPDKSNGWKLLHVYVGTNATVEHTAHASTIPKDFFFGSSVNSMHSPLQHQPPPPQTQPVWFSQLRQDYLISKLLREKRGGYFVDLAANDAIRISNTFALETYFGWKGLAIEPNPVYWSGLAFRKCDVAAAVVGKATGEELRFKFPKRAAPKGGLVGQDFDNKEQADGKAAAHDDDEDQMRFTVTIRDIFERFNTPRVIDYLSLDVEGAETFVMESFPFDRYRINLLTVERADATLCALLVRNGYIQLKQLKRWGETLWVHSAAASSVDMSALDIDTENYKYRERVSHTTGTAAE